MIKIPTFIIIVDVGVGKLIEEWLVKTGFKVIAIRNLNPEMADNRYN